MLSFSDITVIILTHMHITLASFLFQVFLDSLGAQEEKSYVNKFNIYPSHAPPYSR